MMKKLMFLIALTASAALSACVPANFYYPSVSQPRSHQTYNTAPTFRGLPSTYAEFKNRCQSACQSPEGAVKMYFDAVFCYLTPSKRGEASKMLRYILHADANWERSPNYSTFVRRLRDSSYHYIFRSFADGTYPENNYSMSPGNYNLVFSHCDEYPDYIKLFLVSSGADSPRPILVKQFDDGLWYVISNSSTYSNVRQPQTKRNSYSHDAEYDRYRR